MLSKTRDYGKLLKNRNFTPLMGKKSILFRIFYTHPIFTKNRHKVKLGMTKKRGVNEPSIKTIKSETIVSIATQLLQLFPVDDLQKTWKHLVHKIQH